MKKPYCTCIDTDLRCPKDINSLRCNYCGKPTYAVWKSNNKCDCNIKKGKVCVLCANFPLI